MGVQPLPIRTLGSDLEIIRKRSLLWRGIAVAERAFSGALLLLLLPLLIFAAVTVLVLSRRAPLIAHPRMGQGGRAIWVLKLRTMWDRSSPANSAIRLVERLASESNGYGPIKNREDPRITSRFAAFCRKYSIDELPQLWHVCRGEMALIGPRPLTAQEIEMHYHSAADELLSATPGLTGLWQIKGRSRLTYLQRRRLDLFLVRKWSLGLYGKIFFATIPTVLTGKDAW